MNKALCFLALASLLMPAAAHAADVVEIVSPQGLHARLIRSDRLPLISMSFAFRGGVETDPADKQGLAVLTTGLLTQGAGPYDEAAFQDALAARSIRLSVSAQRDALVGSLKTLRREKDEAFRLLALALTKPRFDEESLARAKAQQLAAMREQLAAPAWQARYALFQHIFAGHPYGYRSLGSRASLEGITRADVTAFARRRLAKDNVLVTIVGDITPGEVRTALDRIFGHLPAKATPLALSDVTWPDKASLILVPREKSRQTRVVFAAPMMKRCDEDWYAAEVANYILGGGGFVSRLMKKVREEEGLTYGIGTGLAAMEKTSALMGDLSADNDKADRALALTKDVWRAFYENGATDAEVEAGKAYLSGSIPLALASTDKAAAVLLNLWLDGFGKDELARRKKLIEAVTTRDVNRVVRRWFNPEAVSFALVGAPDGVEPDQERQAMED